jgi:hypothetical protein
MLPCSRAKLHLVFFGDGKYLRNWRPKENAGFNLFQEIMKFASAEKVGFREYELENM